jgi:hypothetical protein
LIPSAPGAHGSLDSLRAFIGEVVVHNQDSVHGGRRQQDREQEAHNVN